MHLMKIRGLIYHMTVGQGFEETADLLRQVHDLETSMNKMGDRVSRESAQARVRERKRLHKLHQRLAKAGRKISKAHCTDPNLLRKRKDDEDDPDGHQGGGGTSAGLAAKAS